MGDVFAFQYGELDQYTRGFIREAAGRIRVRLARSSNDIAEAGVDLLAVKGRIPHGQFLAWVNSEFNMSERTAQWMMSVAKKYVQHPEVSKSADFAEMPISALYHLLDAPAEVVAEVQQMSQNGEAVTAATVKELRAKNKKLREERDIARTEKEGTEAFVEGATSKLHDAICEIQYLTKELERLAEDNTVEARIVHDDGPLRQALMAFWQQLPQETQEWFLSEVGK